MTVWTMPISGLMLVLGFVLITESKITFAADAPVGTETWSETCRRAGGKIKIVIKGDKKASVCACKDGSEIYPSYKTCPNFKRIPPSKVLTSHSCLEESTEEPLHIQDLKDFISKKKPKSPRDAIEKMKEDKKWGKFYTASQSSIEMRYSNSRQKRAVDPKHKRKIAFAQGMILATVRHPKHPRLNQGLEVMECDKNKENCELYLIDFSKDPPATIGPNPMMCTRCHGQKPRPIWSSYPAWPGTDDFSLANTPSQEFNDFLREIMGTRLVRNLKSNNQWDSYKYAALAALLNCGDISTFIKAKPKTGYETILQDTKKTLNNYYDDLYQFAKENGEDLESAAGKHHGKGRNDLEDAEFVSGLRFLFEASGLELSNYFPGFSPGRHLKGYGGLQLASGSGAGIQPKLLCGILPNVIGEDKELMVLAEAMFYTPENACALLKAKSLNQPSLKEEVPPQPPPSVPEDPNDRRRRQQNTGVSFPEETH